MRQLAKRAGAGVAAAVVWAGLMASLAGCTAGGAGADAKPRTPEQAIRVLPLDRAQGVRQDGRVEVSVPDGHLERVRVVQVGDAKEQEIKGAISDDGRSWHPVGPSTDNGLRLAAKYTVDALAEDGTGHRQARHTTFTTYVPEHRFIGYFKPENNSTVGTGMIVSFDFNRSVENRAAVERAIRVTSQPPVDVVGHWFGDRRLDFRPEQYWKPGTKVSIDMRLRDVQAATGVYGIQQKTVGFTVGRSQVSTVDADAHTMTVRRDGKVLQTLPVTAGAPSRTTYNGKMVVSELYDVTRMNGQTVGFGGEYDIPDVPHAMRLTNSGTFLHGNYWASSGTFGSANTSHGCVSLRDVKGGSSDTPAGWFFDRTLVGDVVEVINSHDKTVAPDNGLGGWNLDWGQWKAGSALGWN
ncbi:L,D-transpeptidase [Streptomyces sp. NBC_01465]|uniref:L,D-transpeptidase n=1 Tax=Streptomyces sp. NBC_01465 TaxID=2903878 RepID=UPI002E311712|nr:Ig-like domain-containing protein [Streptomyces sp. NBC_01465]